MGNGKGIRKKRPKLPHEMLDNVLEEQGIIPPSKLLDKVVKGVGLCTPSEVADKLYDMNSIKKRAEIIVKGRVQKVGYRDIVKNIADKLGVVGYIENLKNGDVRIVAEGDEEILSEFKSNLAINNPIIQVNELEIKYSVPVGEFDCFSINISDPTIELEERYDQDIRYFAHLTKEVNGIKEELKGIKELGGTFSADKPELFEYDVAISFAGEDRKIAEELASALRDKGVRVFYDEFYKSDLWGKKLTKHFREVYGPKARFIILLISKYYPVKDWTDFEFSIARKEAKERKVEFILPVKLDDTKILGIHEDTVYLDFNKEGIDGIVKCFLEKLSSQKISSRENLSVKITDKIDSERGLIDIDITSHDAALSKEEFKTYAGCDLPDSFMVNFKGAYSGLHKIGESSPNFGVKIKNSGNVAIKNLKVDIIPHFINCDGPSRIRNDEICTFKYFFNPTNGAILNKAPETYEADIVLVMEPDNSIVYWVLPNVRMYGLGTHLIDCSIYVSSTEPPLSWSGYVYYAITNYVEK